MIPPGERPPAQQQQQQQREQLEQQQQGRARPRRRSQEAPASPARVDAEDVNMEQNNGMESLEAGDNSTTDSTQANQTTAANKRERHGQAAAAAGLREAAGGLLVEAASMKPARSLSIIIGDHGRSTSHLNNLHLCAAGQYCAAAGRQNAPAACLAAAGPNYLASGLKPAPPLAACKRGAAKLSSAAGHQLHAQYSMPCSLNSRRQTQHAYQLHHSLLDEQIIYCQLSIAAKKDFAEEVRALLDIRKFVTDSFILTDVAEVRIESIVETIIDRLVECRQLGHQVGEEAKTLLFVERNSLSMLLGNTMQGLYKSRSDGRLAYDQSWIVATGSLSGLHKRQVAITRFSQPVNFGRHSQEVRFLIIVLAPSKEKLTKSAWETGRTFATMFTDIEFRRRLLKAKSQEEFKVELLVRAESLARESSRPGDGGALVCGALAPAHSISELDELQLQLQQQQDELDHQLAQAAASALAQRNQAAGGNNSSNKSKRPQAGPTLPMNSIALFDTKMLQHQQAELARKKEQLRLLRQQQSLSNSPSQQQQQQRARNGKKRPSAGSTNSSVSSTCSGKHFKETGGEPAAGCCQCACLPASLRRPLNKLAAGLLDDLKRRSRFYLSDFTDGFLGERSLYKTISTTIFLYFSVLLPCIAFGVVDTNNTDGAIDPKKTMIGQALGGLFFALFSGQPLIVVMTTAPLCIYVKVTYQISQDLEVDFGSFYAAVGLWMAFFLFLMSVTNASNLMKHCTRSTEDIFALFTAVAFGSDGVREAIRSFQKYYWEPDCLSTPTVALTGSGGGAAIAHSFNSTTAAARGQPASIMHGALHEYGAGAGGHQQAHHGGAAAAAAESAVSLMSRCQRETCVLFLFLMCGTLWLANSFNSFDRTPYLSTRKREIIKDYALAISVLIFSFIGSYLFADIRLDVFEFADFTGLHLAQLGHLNPLAWATAGLLGFMASVLFYIDQNICAAMVNNAPYKLKKGNYFHLDLLVLALLNTFLSLTGLPWMHGKLPHSHLHSKALADYEERVDEGHIHQMIVNIRETRLTCILVSVLVALSLLAVPYPLSYIPLPVLSGVFLYTALAEFKSNSMVERICLLFTEQVAYPPNHYIRRCPQRKIHLFTLAQILLLAIVSFIGFYPNPYVNMAFPLVVATFVPVRELLLPKLIEAKYLHSLDSASLE